MLQLQRKNSFYKILLKSFKKLISVLTTFALITKTSKKDDMVLESVSYIHNLIWFKKSLRKALINFGSKVNAIFLRKTLKFGLKVYHTIVRAQKIDNSIIKILEIVLASFQVENMLGKACFFWKTFFEADFNIKVIFGIPFFIFNLPRKNFFRDFIVLLKLCLPPNR